MDSNKVCYCYYLSGEGFSAASPGGFLCFSAKFSESSAIKDCFIIASSLSSALSVLYKELIPIWGEEYLDNHLLSVSFRSKVCY